MSAHPARESCALVFKYAEIANESSEGYERAHAEVTKRSVKRGDPALLETWGRSDPIVKAVPWPSLTENRELQAFNSMQMTSGSD